jgi:hypothetical protein
MFKWLRSRRHDSTESVSEPVESDDTGEDAYESEEEVDSEISPSGMTRVKTDEI